MCFVTIQVFLFYFPIGLIRMSSQTGEVAQWVEVLAAKSGDFSSIRSHGGIGDLSFVDC